MRPRALDLFCCAGGMAEGLRLAGFEVTGVDINPQPRFQSGTFVQADALTFPLEGFSFLHASPPCQSHSSLRHLQKGKVYPCHIEEIRTRFVASGIPWCIENVEGAPLGSGGFLTRLCGTMFGLVTPDGRAEIRRHRLFETSFSIWPRLACRHGGESLSVCGTGLDSNAVQWAKRRALSVVGAKGLPGLSHARRALCVTGHAAEIRSGATELGEKTSRQPFSTDDARAAMQTPWMTMEGMSQAVPPPYGRHIGEKAIEAIRAGRGFA